MRIVAEGLSKSYGSQKALDNVSITCKSGTITGLLGPNGAGKSTLFKLLFGTVRADKGHFKIHSSHKKAIGGIIEKPNMYGYLNAEENLRLFASIQKADTSKVYIQSLLEKVGLPENRKDPVKNYSLGMKQRLGIAVALINDPRALVLDEPFSGLDPIGVDSLRDLILNLAKKEDIAILIASHNISEMSKLCDFLYVIQEGRIIRANTTNTLLSQFTEGYRILGNNLQPSATLERYHPIHTANGVEISCTPDDIAGILRQLTEEGAALTSCIPMIDTKGLFETSSL